MHEFYYSSGDFYSAIEHGSSDWNLPVGSIIQYFTVKIEYYEVTNLYHALTLLCFCAHMIVCPVGYWAIYRSVL